MLDARTIAPLFGQLLVRSVLLRPTLFIPMLKVRHLWRTWRLQFEWTMHLRRHRILGSPTLRGRSLRKTDEPSRGGLHRRPVSGGDHHRAVGRCAGSLANSPSNEKSVVLHFHPGTVRG